MKTQTKKTALSNVVSLLLRNVHNCSSFLLDALKLNDFMPCKNDDPKKCYCSLRLRKVWPGLPKLHLTVLFEINVSN